MKTLLLTAAALLTLSAPAFAQNKPALPEGSWGDLASTPGALPECLPKPFLDITEKKITISMDTGQGHCKIRSLKQKSPKVIHGKFDCIWDKTIPPEQLDGGDSDQDAFSVAIKSENTILYNNVLMGRCPAPKSAGQ